MVCLQYCFPVNHQQNTRPIQLVHSPLIGAVIVWLASQAVFLLSGISNFLSIIIFEIKVLLLWLKNKISESSYTFLDDAFTSLYVFFW